MKRCCPACSIRLHGVLIRIRDLGLKLVSILVILDGDPLEDFRLIGSRVAALFMDGKLVINNCGLSVESAR